MPERTPYDAASPRARHAGQAIERLLEAARHQDRTVQLMPHHSGVRFEVIDVGTGDFEAVAYVDCCGSIYLREGDPHA